MDFSSAVINGVPLVLVVIGLVEWVKQMGVAGQMLKIVSLAVGLALGLAYQYSVQPPVDFAGWFGAAIYGLGLGLVACGIFDAARSATQPKNQATR